MVGFEGQELAGGAPAYHGASLLGVAEIAVGQEHLLPGFEGWHPKVGAAGAAESIAQVALLGEETIIRRSGESACPRFMGGKGIPRFLMWP